MMGMLDDLRRLTRDQQTQQQEDTSVAEQAVDAGYLPEDYGYDSIRAGLGKADIFGILPTNSKTYADEQIKKYLNENPQLINNFLEEQPEGLRQVLTNMSLRDGPITFFKKLVRKNALSAPKEIFDPKEEAQLQKDDPTFFAANQDRINRLHATSDYTQRNIDGRQISVFNPNASFLEPMQRFALAGLTGEQRLTYLKKNFNERNGFDVQEVPVALDKNGQVLDSEFIIRKLDDRGLPVEVRRVDPFGDEAAFRSGGFEILNDLADLLETEEGRADLADFFGSVVNEKVIAENAVYAAVLAKTGGLPILAKIALGSIGSGGTNYIFQAINELVRTGAVDSKLDKMEAIYSGIGALFGGFADFVRPYIGSPVAQLAKTRKADREKVLAASERLGISVNLQTLVNSPFLNRIINQAGQLRPKKFKDIRLEAGPKIKQKLDRGEQIQTPTITPNNFNSYLAQEKTNIFNELSGLARYEFANLSDPGVQIGVPTARLALQRLTNFQDQMKTLRNGMYKNALKGAPDIEIDFTDALENYRVLLDAAREKAPARFLGKEKEIDTGLLDETGAPTTRTNRAGFEQTTLGPLPKELEDIADEIAALNPKMSSTQVGDEVFPVLEQIYNLRRRFNAKLYRLAKDDEGGALLDRMRPVEAALDNMVETIIQKAPADVKEQLVAGNSVARLISDLPKVDFFADALFAGDRNAFAVITGNLLSGKTPLNEDTRALFYDIANAVAIKNRAAKKAGALTSELAITSFDDFKKLVGESALVGLATNPNTFLDKLGNLMGGAKIENLSDLADLRDNDNLKFLFPEEQIENIIKYATTAVSAKKSLAKITAAQLSKDSSTRDILKVMAESVGKAGGLDAGSKQLQELLGQFAEAKPQIRAFIFDDLLKKAAPNGDLNFGALRTAIDNLKNGTDEAGKPLRDIYNFAFSDADGKMLDNQLLDDLELIAGRLTEAAADSGADIATGAEAGKIAKGAIVTSAKTALDFLRGFIVAGNIAHFATKPIEAKRIAAIGREVDNAFTTQKMIKQLINFSFSTYMQNKDIDFETIDFDASSTDEDGNMNIKLRKALNLIDRQQREVIKRRRDNFQRDPSVFEYIEKQMDDLAGDEGDDRLPAAPAPMRQTGLGIPATTPTAGRGIAALPTPATVQQLQQVGLPLFGGTRG